MPAIAQQFVNHGGRVYKVYVAGSKVLDAIEGGGISGKGAEFGIWNISKFGLQGGRVFMVNEAGSKVLRGDWGEDMWGRCRVLHLKNEVWAAR